MKKNWVLAESVSEDKVERLSKELGISKIVSEILVSRGYATTEKADKFLNPKIEDLHSPFLMPQMEQAVNRITQAIKAKEKILIYGDYDVDGTTAASLLYNIFRKFGLTTEVYIPNRLAEGYGLTEKGVEYCSSSYVNLIITVDCGVTNVKEVGFLQDNGIDVIVTDHHESEDKLPPAFAILNPKVGGGYPFRELCGCGIAFKLGQAICERLGLETQELMNCLDLVALATVCDVTPLVEENRIIAKYGMKTLANTQNTGLQALLESVGLKNHSIDTRHLGFVLGPQINARGRLGEAKDVVKLFTTADREEADKIANKLKQENIERRSIQEKILEEALQEVEKINLSEKKAIVLAKKGWHPGVIGIVASRLVEKFHRPAILIDEDSGRGSGRSISSFHLYNTLSQCKKLLTNFGGHRLAAGLTIEPKNIQLFKEEFETLAFSQLMSEELIPKFFIDKEITHQEITEDLFNEVRRFAPFGVGNPRPVFLTERLQVVGYPKIVGKNHIKFKVRGEGHTGIKAIGFNLGGISKNLATGQYINLIYSLDEERWLGESNILLKVKDIEILKT
ncbi:single-stranded-DNA-specific exonuclease RecJ [candidate division WOR-3 bacterium]|nr:single-stranded-DNA-specific exonuclease RecJ [candidate division WOR-3 bacterium]